jgi:hypothetical protein
MGPSRDDDPVADRAYTAIAHAADARISASQYVREAAPFRAVLDEVDPRGGDP